MSQTLIYETHGSVKDLKVTEHNGLMTLSGVFGVCGIRNNNKRVYERGNYAKMVQEVQSRIKENGGIPGTLEHENSMYVTLENISHKITKVDIDESGVVTGTIELLNTPKGKIAQAIVEGGLPLFISSRAMGQVDKNGNVTLERISAWDLVSQPGFSEARLHLNESQLMESLGDNCVCVVEKNGNNILESEMDYQKLYEKIEALESKIANLESDNAELREALEEKPALSDIAEGIQNWCVRELADGIENWICEEFSKHMKNEVIKECTSMIIEKVAPAVQKWVLEDYSESLEKWICEHYSPEVENWFVKQVAPGIQQWMVESFAPEVETWLNEQYCEKVKDVAGNVVAESKDSKLQSIKDTLNLLESMEVAKPQFGTTVITENTTSEPAYIKNMPEAARVKYNMASKEIRESIDRRARIYDFSKEGSMERFWESINFEEIKPTQNIYEGLNNITDQREREIRMAFRRKRSLF